MTIAKISKSLSVRLSLASLVAAVAVVGIHSPKAESIADGWQGFLQWMTVYNVGVAAVPAFFLISGFLLAGSFERENWWRESLKKRIRTLLIPYLIWCSFSIFFFWLLQCVAEKSLVPVSFCDSIGLNPFSSPQIPYWFLRELMIFILVSPLICWVAKHELWRWHLVACLLLSIASSVIVMADGSLYCLFFRTLDFGSFFFFSVGALLRCRKIKNLHWGVSFFVWLLLVVVHYLGATLMGVGMDSVAWTFLQLIKSCALIDCVWRLIPEIELPPLLVGLSFPLYVMHIPIMGILSSICVRLPQVSNTYVHRTLVGGWSMIAITLLIGILINWFLQHHFRTLRKIIFGNR